MTSTKAKAVHFRSSGRSNWRITFITKGVALLYQDLDVQVEAEETKITGLSAQKGSRSERLVTIWQGFVDRGFSVKMLQNGLGLRATDDRGQRGRVSLLHRLQAAEVLQQTSRGLRANSRDIQKFCLVDVPGIGAQTTRQNFWMSRSSVLWSRISRRLRWKVTAKRCASSRTNCTRCS